MQVEEKEEEENKEEEEEIEEEGVSWCGKPSAVVNHPWIIDFCSGSGDENNHLVAEKQAVFDAQSTDEGLKAGVGLTRALTSLSVTEVGNLLGNLKLQKYKSAFEEHEVDGDTLYYTGTVSKRV